MCRLLKGTQFFRTGPFIIYARDGLARMRGGSRRTQDSQGGGGSLRNLHTKRRGYLIFYFSFITGAQPKAGTGLKMQTVSVVFSTLHC